MDDHTGRTVAAALAVARLRAFRMAVLALHKAVLDAERARYEREHGPIGGPHEALRLVVADPFFAWLRPLAAFVVQSDERLAEEAPVTASDLDAFAAQLRALLLGGANEAFSREYLRLLQATPDVVVAHGQVMALLNHP